MKKKSLLILQNTIRVYRKPLFNFLAEYYDVTVLHSGEKILKKSDLFNEIVIPKKLVWKFNIQPKLQIRRIVRDFDVVIAMFDVHWPYYFIPLFFNRQNKYILWGHWYSTNRLINFVRNYLMRKADKLLMYGGQEIERMIKSGISPDNIIIAPNTYYNKYPTDSSRSNKSSFLFIGRLQAGTGQNSKRVDLLLRAFAKIEKLIRKDIVIDIVGDGDELDGLQKLALRLGIAKKVKFYGHLDDDESLIKLFSKSIAMVSPGHVGLSVLQAFSYGVPVVTGKAIKYREETQHLLNLLTEKKVVLGPEYYNLVNEENSILVESLIELQCSLQRLCNDRNFSVKLGKNAFQFYVKKRSITHMVDGFKEAIE